MVKTPPSPGKDKRHRQELPVPPERWPQGWSARAVEVLLDHSLLRTRGCDAPGSDARRWDPDGCGAGRSADPGARPAAGRDRRAPVADRASGCGRRAAAAHFPAGARGPRAAPGSRTLPAVARPSRSFAVLEKRWICRLRLPSFARILGQNQAAEYHHQVTSRAGSNSDPPRPPGETTEGVGMTDRWRHCLTLNGPAGIFRCDGRRGPTGRLRASSSSGLGPARLHAAVDRQLRQFHLQPLSLSGRAGGRNRRAPQRCAVRRSSAGAGAARHRPLARTLRSGSRRHLPRADRQGAPVACRCSASASATRASARRSAAGWCGRRCRCTARSAP